MRIHAAVLEEFGQPLEVQELELDEPLEGEVLVRLEACGVCPRGFAPYIRVSPGTPPS